MCGAAILYPWYYDVGFSAAPLRGFAAYGLGVNAFLALVVLGMRSFIGWRAGDAALAPAPPNKRARTKNA